LSDQFLAKCDWSGISPQVVQTIRTARNRWDKYRLDHLFRFDAQSKIRIRQISPGHWAWSSELGPVQYETVAIDDIDQDEFICEYVGKVKYFSECQDSHYVAQYFCPPEVQFQDSLVVDAAERGNEARYINSVTSDTPNYIKKNASMSTVWCKAQLRIVVYAIVNIAKSHPIIIDSNE